MLELVLGVRPKLPYNILCISRMDIHVHLIFCCVHADTVCRSGDVFCPRGRMNSFMRCIPESRVCDGIQDCVGGTDEMNCTEPSKTFIVNRNNSVLVVYQLLCQSSLQQC